MTSDHGHDATGHLDPFRHGEPVDWHVVVEGQRAHVARVDRWWELLDRPTGQHLADVGCGPGVPAARLAELGAIVLAVDRRADALAHVPAHPRLSTLEHDLEAGPLPEAVDIIVLSGVLHHAHDPGRMLRNARASAHRILVAENTGPPHAIRLAPDTVAHLLQEAGFEPQDPAWAQADHYAIVATSVTG